MLDRYKKSGGFIALLTLLETSPLAKRDNFLRLIKEENPAWEEALIGRILTLEKIFSWPSEAVMEITARVQPMYLAAISGSLAPEMQQKLMTGIPVTVKRQMDEILKDKQFTPAEISTCRDKFLQETRGLISTNVLKLDKFDPSMAVPEGIEDKIGAKPKLSAVDDISASLKIDVPSSAGGGSKEQADEISALRKKINLVAQENVTLKQENIILKDKLEKIKRIA